MASRVISVFVVALPLLLLTTAKSTTMGFTSETSSSDSFSNLTVFENSTSENVTSSETAGTGSSISLTAGDAEIETIPMTLVGSRNEEEELTTNLPSSSRKPEGSTTPASGSGVLGCITIEIAFTVILSFLCQHV